ncbi:hypothetical protein C8Q80DRAFT_1275134 [Daedaleopsis nitida]|nr:hypothetical protein C8Q80DRAFT_1275134 [Daedaleopsis nitida]
MPVTFTVVPNLKASQYLHGWQPKTPFSFLQAISEDISTKVAGVYQSSVTKADLPNLVPFSNGFVHAAVQAYGSHRHLRIRPDDVWLAILTQLSFYVNAHAEDLRQYFVSHEGQKALKVYMKELDFAKITRQFAQLIHENVADSTLVEWILPDFSTTTLTDRTICSVVMMATLKAYFSYGIGIVCGIPSVTLEGTKADWQEIYHRLYRLYELGDEPSIWAEMLRPIVRRFIDSFDGKHDLQFWQHIVYRSQEYCGQDDLDGWITAFCVWTPKGVWKPRVKPAVIPTQPSIIPPAPVRVRRIPEDEEELGSTAKDGVASSVRRRISKVLPNWKRLSHVGRHPGSPSRASLAGSSTTEVDQASNDDAKTEDKESVEDIRRSGSVMTVGRYGCDKYTLDGVEYFTLSMEDIPAGYAEVDVSLFDSGVETKCMMIAGHVGFSVSSKVPGGVLDTVSPAPHWFMCPKRRRKA